MKDFNLSAVIVKGMCFFGKIMTVKRQIIGTKTEIGIDKTDANTTMK